MEEVSGSPACTVVCFTPLTSFWTEMPGLMTLTCAVSELETLRPRLSVPFTEAMLATSTAGAADVYVHVKDAAAASEAPLWAVQDAGRVTLAPLATSPR